MKVIIGLGNPGLRYRKTRHNAGFMAVDLLAKRHRLRFKKGSFNSKCVKGRVFSHDVLLVKPLTYMNRSGEAVGPVMRHYGLEPADLLVVSDDIDLSLGRLRLRSEGSSGGHNGLRSIIGEIGQGFARLRMGVASGEIYDAAGYVLAPFRKAEAAELENMLSKAADCMESWLEKGLSVAMNKYNKPD